MKKVYLVDSENVGDVWVPLLAATREEDLVLIFYTQKSPHMNYETLRLLKETQKEPVFVKCFEGNNALDFQLVTELGYRLREDKNCDFVIISNDTGYDAVTRYWNERKMSVSRLSGADCAKQLSDKNTNEKIETAFQPEEAVDAVTKKTKTVSKAPKVKKTAKTQQPSKENETDAIVRQLCSCIGKDKLAEFHNAMLVFFGRNAGNALYRTVKTDPKWDTYWSGAAERSQKEKFDIYCKTVFAHSEPAIDYPKDFAAFLVKAGVKRENLNSLGAALRARYGKDKGAKYYSLIKPHVKVINRM